MNNEEKILEMLVNLTVKVDSIDKRVDSIDQRTTKLEISQENTIIPALKALAEGHALIRQDIRKLSVIDAMQDDIATLKTAVKYLSSELEQLKKAQ